MLKISNYTIILTFLSHRHSTKYVYMNFNNFIIDIQTRSKNGYNIYSEKITATIIRNNTKSRVNVIVKPLPEYSTQEAILDRTK